MSKITVRDLQNFHSEFINISTTLISIQRTTMTVQDVFAFSSGWNSLLAAAKIDNAYRAIKLEYVYQVFTFLENMIYEIESNQDFDSIYPGDYRANWDTEYVNIKDQVVRWQAWLEYEKSIAYKNTNTSLSKYTHTQLSAYKQDQLMSGGL